MARNTSPTPQSREQRGSLPHYWSLLEIGERIRRREISPVEAREAQLTRIESLDSKLNAFQLVMADRARAEAKQPEAEIRADRYRGPLHGVPIALKDLLYTKGITPKGGLKVLADFVPPYDATVTAKTESPGAVVLGKLNSRKARWEGTTGIFRCRATLGIYIAPRRSSVASTEPSGWRPWLASFRR